MSYDGAMLSHTLAVIVARRLPPIAVVGLAAVLLAGCKGRDSEKKTTENPPPKTDQRRSLSMQQVTAKRARKDFQKPPDLPELKPVKLIAAGDQPRAPLRYQLDDAAREFTITTSATVREYNGEVWTEPRAIPDITIGLGIRRSGADNRLWVIDIRGLKAKIGTASDAPDGSDRPPARPDARPDRGPTPQVEPAAVDEFLSRYRTFVERRRAQLALTDVGRPGKPILSPDARMGKDAKAIGTELSQLLLERLVPLPEEAVGKGARWRAVSLLYRGRNVVKQTAEYELLSKPGERVRLSMRVTQIGEQQMINAPELGPQQRPELISLFWQIAGEIELSVTAPTPISGSVSTELRVHGRMVSPRGTREYSLESQGRSVLRTTGGGASR